MIDLHAFEEHIADEFHEIFRPTPVDEDIAEQLLSDSMQAIELAEHIEGPKAATEQKKALKKIRQTFKQLEEQMKVIDVLSIAEFGAMATSSVQEEIYQEASDVGSSDLEREAPEFWDSLSVIEAFSVFCGMAGDQMTVKKGAPAKHRGRALAYYVRRAFEYNSVEVSLYQDGAYMQVLALLFREYYGHAEESAAHRRPAEFATKIDHRRYLASQDDPIQAYLSRTRIDT